MIAFDDRTGRLTLDQAAFDRLVAMARGEALANADLEAAGAVRRGVLHPALAAGLRAVIEPVCRLRVTLSDGAQKRGDGWVRGDAAALLLDRADGARDLHTIHPTLLPAAIARLVSLGPRPRPGLPDRTWRAEMTWTGRGGEETGRSVHVADAATGLCLLEKDGARTPASPSAVFRRLIRLLPDTAELPLIRRPVV